MIATRNFKPSEFACPCCKANNTQQELVNRLQHVRDDIKQAMVISSGYRCPKHNKAVGGEQNSAHTKGLAVDIVCNHTAYRWLLITSLIKYGFDRIGIYKGYIHADLDYSLPANQIWVK